MSLEQIGPAETLRMIRMTRQHVVSSAPAFVTHIYRTVLGREPEYDPSAVELPALSVGDSWERCGYLFATLLGTESVEFVNTDYDALLKALFRGLGYISTGPILANLFKDNAFTYEEFKTKADTFLGLIATNTQRIFFSLDTEAVSNELDGVLSLKANAERFRDLADEVASLREAIKDVGREVRELRFNTTQPVAGSLDYTNGLLLAVIARLETTRFS